MTTKTTTTALTTSDLFLVTPRAALKGFTLARDREYFSRPVRVELHHSDAADRTLYVRDPKRGDVYPVNVKHLVPAQRLPKAALIADGYIRNHGANPRGHGHWAFGPQEITMPADCFWWLGNYGDAKQRAAHHARINGWPEVWVQS